MAAKDAKRAMVTREELQGCAAQAEKPAAEITQINLYGKVAKFKQTYFRKPK